MDRKIFVDRFDNNNYILSIKEVEKYIDDIAVVYKYQQENPFISITGKQTLSDVKKIIYTIEEQQKDIDLFGKMLIELNAD